MKRFLAKCLVGWACLSGCTADEAGADLDQAAVEPDADRLEVVDLKPDGALADEGPAEAGGPDEVPADVPPAETGDARGECTGDSCGGQPFQPCLKGSDCPSGLCVQGPDGRVCTIACVEECPSGFKCALYQPALPDEIYICAPLFVSLCRPCRLNADCHMNGTDVSEACVAVGPEGAFCGAACEVDEDCPSGFTCQGSVDVSGTSVFQCLKVDGQCECNKWFVDEGASTDCYVENEHGHCDGERACLASGLSDCDAEIPVVEMCNGFDDDCDGLADEEIGPIGCVVANAFGTCPGIESCSGGKSVCDGPQPKAETCDGEDNDCDGQTDEGFEDTNKDGIADCLVNDKDGDGVVDGLDNCPALFNPGQADFDLDTVGDPCDPDDDNDLVADEDDCAPKDPEAKPGLDETCDGKDNNCNFLVDEGFPDSDFDGWKNCVDDDDDGDGSPDGLDCDPQAPSVHPGAPEICDGIDNDCDGQQDEELGTLACGKGLCLHTQEACSAGKPQVCDPMAGASTEVCDGQDNDCDGLSDEDFGKTTCGLGICLHTTDNCLEGSPQLCDPKAGSGPEVCDGLDNDCDGKTDEELGQLACGKGPCSHSVPACLGGVPQVCNPTEGAKPELCDGVDNDCDGAADDGFGKVSCGKGLCLHQQAVCADGKTKVCDPYEGAKPEVCDGDDNDCDGLTDEDLGKTTCGLGLCLHTTDNCLDGSPQLCDPKAGSGPEVCDGLDNDCDGKTDEELGTLACGKGSCAHSVKACIGGEPQECNPFEGAQPESCDGVDNDCDGAVDEELGTVTCGQGACKHSQPYCEGGKVSICDAFAGVAPEVCDGLDNDCDGLADDGLGTESCGVGICFHVVKTCVDGVPQVCDPMAGAETETCDGLDNDCDGTIDPEDADGCQKHYVDADKDGYGVTGSSLCLCDAEAPYTATIAGDCDDGNLLVNPGVPEDCDSASDEDCSGAVNDDCVYSTCFAQLKVNPLAKTGNYLVDTDLGGPKPPFTVYCDMETDGGGWAVFHHDKESNKVHVKGFENPGSFAIPLKYDLPVSQIQDYIVLSGEAKQYLFKECKGSLIWDSSGAYTWFTNGSGVKVNYWPGGSSQCDINDNVWRQNGGWVTVKSDLPVTSVLVGDTGDSNEEAYMTMGPLWCR